MSNDTSSDSHTELHHYTPARIKEIRTEVIHWARKERVRYIVVFYFLILVFIIAFFGGFGIGYAAGTRTCS